MNKEEAKKLTRAQRYSLRKKGINVPKFSAGVHKGYKQTKEHIARRIRFGENHCNWKGNDIVVRSGRSRALRKFKVEYCEKCGIKNVRLDRHHKDENTKNNLRSNIVILCRKCHMIEDGRMKAFIKMAKENQPNAVAARWN